MTGGLTRRDVGALTGAAILGAAAPARAAPRRHVVDIRRFVFNPAILTIRQGDSVEWTNGDPVPHTATSSEGDWDTGEMKRRESRVVVFTKAGRMDYFCAYHPKMRATVIVEKAGD